MPFSSSILRAAIAGGEPGMTYSFASVWADTARIVLPAVTLCDLRLDNPRRAAGRGRWKHAKPPRRLRRNRAGGALALRNAYRGDRRRARRTSLDAPRPPRHGAWCRRRLGRLLGGSTAHARVPRDER